VGHVQAERVQHDLDFDGVYRESANVTVTAGRS
jgi:hypothetical protein